ncbi:MAG: acyl-CoA thioesterase [Muribaculaceae bacterium]|nr:acyl-CoA thioesterase [Muribaculaceae bacterium]
MKHDIPALPFEFRHRIPVQIRFNDIDMFGHVNNAVYLQFFDMGKLAYFKQFMGGSFEHEPTVPVVANLNVNFYHPTLIDERISVVTAVASVSTSSLVLEQRVIAEGGSVKCTARTIMVNIDTKTGAPTPVSEAWRKAFADYEGREF